MKRSVPSIFPLSLISLPLAMAGTPAARWGHQAVYVPSQKAMYVVGGEVTSSGAQITNEVLVLPLNETDPTFSTGPADGLPPHAFAALGVAGDGESLVIIGGMTSSCSSDAVGHSLDLAGDGSWVAMSPSNLVRRRGASLAAVSDGSSEGEMLLVGGLADPYACASSTYAYPAADLLSLPLSSSSVVSTASLPANLTGAELAVSDFAMASASDGTIYMTAGQSAAGELVSLSTIGKWTKAVGWTSQTTSGDVPAARIGASLVAHPSLDVLILHGGSVVDNSTNVDTPTSLLALLNTTTWTWSSPSALQPPAASAAAFHSAVMTSSGVMITAFGLATSGSPRSDMYYLDMRDATGAAWSWKSSWTSDMLGAYSSSDSTNGTSSSGVAATTGNSSASSSAPSARTLTSIFVPVVIVCVLLLPIAIYLVRRRVRLIRQRRAAKHFSFSSQEDSGDFLHPLDQYLNRSSRRTKTQYPFGTDMNEKEGSWLTDAAAGLSTFMQRLSLKRSAADEAEHESFEERGTMLVSKRGSKLSKLSEKMMKWEEIDFGLGKVDEKRNSHGTESESRRSSFSATGSDGDHAMSDAIPLIGSGNTTFTPEGNGMAPLIVTIDEGSPRVGTPLHDGQIPLIPNVVVMPPSAPGTPAPQSQPLATAYPPIQPSGSVNMPTPAPYGAPAADPSAGLDWSMLAKELEDKPAFRSISPTSTLRSHGHSQAPAPRRPSITPNTHRKPLPEPQVNVHVQTQARSVSAGTPLPTSHPSPGQYYNSSPSPISPSSPTSPISPISPIKPIGPVAYIPAFDFQRPRPSSPAQSVVSVNPKTGRRSSEISLPGSIDSKRSVSQPISTRELTSRRGSAPLISVTPPDFSGGAATGGPAYASASLQGRRKSQLRITNAEVEEGDEEEA